jgi:uncharacterized protein (TIGR00255 family)
MLNSMTGFGSKEAQVAPFGKINIELRSANHKFLDLAFHLPEGFLALEDKIKSEVESRIKRGRVTCVMNIHGTEAQHVFINKGLLKNYLLALEDIKKDFAVENGVSLETLIHLPGVLSLATSKVSREGLWPRLKLILDAALLGLERTRKKEGRSLFIYLKRQADVLQHNLVSLAARFKKIIPQKLARLTTDEERSSFLKNTDISEEVERLAFHIRNFKSKLIKGGVVGKELDFIAQEMQREANTIAAKSCDTQVSAKVVAAKSLIEKIRQQVQNVE